MNEEERRVIIDALTRILENQRTIKIHLGIIRDDSAYMDNEYYHDTHMIEELNKL